MAVGEAFAKQFIKCHLHKYAGILGQVNKELKSSFEDFRDQLTTPQLSLLAFLRPSSYAWCCFGPQKASSAPPKVLEGLASVIARVGQKWIPLTASPPQLPVFGDSVASTPAFAYTSGPLGVAYE